MMRWANASRGALNRVLGGGNSCICYFLGDATLQTDGFWPCGPCLDWLPAGQTPRGVWRWFRTLEPPPSTDLLSPKDSRPPRSVFPPAGPAPGRAERHQGAPTDVRGSNQFAWSRGG